MLIPTRKRPAGLVRSVRSLFARAAQPERIEVLLRLDDDDAESRPAAAELVRELPVTAVVGPRGAGYAGMHEFFNQLAAQSRGEFIGLFNDDATMITEGWDRVVDVQPRCACTLRTKSETGEWPLNCFPIFTRDIYEAMGHVSLSPHCDLWLSILHRRLDLEVPVDIVIRHLKHSEHGASAAAVDEVFRQAESITSQTLHAFGSYENHVKLKADTEAVAARLPLGKRLRFHARRPLMRAALMRRWYWDHGPFGAELRARAERRRAWVVR